MLRYLLMTVTALSLVTGCSSDGDEKRQAYLDADYYTRLEMPPDLTAPDSSRQMTMPEPTQAAREQFEEESKHVGKKKPDESSKRPKVVAPRFDGMQLEFEDGLFWLQVDSPPEKVWPQVIAFWNNEGIKVIRREPVLGFVETDWVSKYREDPDAGFFARIFNKVEPDRIDRFTMRLESVANGNKTKIYIAHSGMEIFVEDHDINWVTRCSESELETELLRRFAMFLGFRQAQLDAFSDNYRPYASRVKIPEDEDNVSEIFVSGQFDAVWNRTLRAVDRLGFERLEVSRDQQKITIAIKKISKEQITEEKDEIAESSWLNQWVSSLGDDSAAGKHFVLKFTNNEQVVKISILNSENKPAKSVFAEQLRTALARELR